MRRLFGRLRARRRPGDHRPPTAPTSPYKAAADDLRTLADRVEQGHPAALELVKLLAELQTAPNRAARRQVARRA